MIAEPFSRRMTKAIQTIPQETMSALMRYHWPGNVRELQNVIERAVILSTRGMLTVSISELNAKDVQRDGQVRLGNSVQGGS
jgi:formate hydrogenlyase transcriptional activator